MKLGLLAGEASGDALGAGVMGELRNRQPGAEFVGVGGTRMLEQGLRSLHPMDDLAMHGIVEPLRRLPELWRLLNRLTEQLLDARIDAFLGVDFNVFNLLLERRLKRRGVPTAHYVSPSVYAWRRGRTRRIARSADLLLTLFPFEPAYYAQSDVRAVFVGHPMADEVEPLVDTRALEARRQRAVAQLNLPADQPVLALLPGSRSSELKQHLSLFLHAAQMVHTELPQAQFVLPCPRPSLREQVEAGLSHFPDLPVTVIDGTGRLALSACQAALVKSGTSTLEAMLLRKPMVVTYRLSPLTYRVVRPLVRTPFVALPNLLAGESLVPEYLQDDAQPPVLSRAVLAQLQAPQAVSIQQQFHELHLTLRQNASSRAADALEALLGPRDVA